MKRDKDDKQSKKKKDFVDDGRVIVDMNVEGFSWYRKRKKKQQKNAVDQPTRKETRALIIAAYKAYLPYFLILLIVFVVVFLIGYLYLN